MDLTYIAIFLIVLGAIIMGSKLLTLLASSAAGTVTLQDSIPEVEFQHIAANYAGAGNFVNEIAAPHSGAAQGDYDFVPQVTQPTFATNKFTMSGANYWQVAANSAWINGLHKDLGATKFTFCFLMSATNLAFTYALSTTAWGGNGVRVSPNSNGLDVGIDMYSNGSNFVTELSSGDLYTLDTPHFVAVVVDGVAQTVTVYIDGVKEIETYTNTNTSTNGADNLLGLCTGYAYASSTAERMFNSGDILYGVAGITKALNDTEVATARAFMLSEAGI